jgi:hypothetical protein
VLLADGPGSVERTAPVRKPKLYDPTAYSLAPTLTQTVLFDDRAQYLPTLTAAGAEPGNEMLVPWSGVIGFESQATGDGRFIEPNALTWDASPKSLRWTLEDDGMHLGAIGVGSIEVMERRPGGKIWASGVLNVAHPEGLRAARGIESGEQAGVSMDLDSVSFELRVAADLIFGSPEMVEEGDGGEPALETDEAGRVTLVEFEDGDELMVTTGARVRGATLVTMPAFANAMIKLDGPIPEEAGQQPGALVASGGRGAPVAPPAAWFEDPKLTGPTPLTVTDDGRVYGHLALWDTCHTGYSGQCVAPPSSPSNYAYFRVGEVVTADGTSVATGRITLDTVHADKTLTARSAEQHYDHTGRAAVDVAAGEDSHGIWIAGAVRPGVTPEQMRTLRASPLSGDWRRIGGSLELIAALAVNLPGFPVPRPQGMVASGGAQISLVASGMVPPSRVIAPGQPGALSEDDLRYLKRLVQRERDEAREAAAGLSSRVALSNARVLARRVAAAGQVIGSRRTLS